MSMGLIKEGKGRVETRVRLGWEKRGDGDHQPNVIQSIRRMEEAPRKQREPKIWSELR